MEKIFTDLKPGVELNEYLDSQVNPNTQVISVGFSTIDDRNEFDAVCLAICVSKNHYDAITEGEENYWLTFNIEDYDQVLNAIQFFVNQGVEIIDE